MVVDDVDIEALEKKKPWLCILSSVKKNYKELKTLDPKLHILIYKCNGDKSELWARDGNQFHHNHLKGLKWLPFVTGEALSPFAVGWEIGDRWD
ncbi:hypothetical protein WN944_005694 [Citrus x changshan-huyou]|uniref:Uncharacterized protein n=1 Tax=Citrus x changshan-huyou TaxID=2935761 RepID=A0AAP0MHU7_9ROSI